MIELATLVLLFSSLCPNEASTLKEAASHIETTYVLEDTAQSTAKELGSVADKIVLTDACRPPQEFAATMTKTLREVSGDGHFYIEPTEGEAEEDWISAWRSSGYSLGHGIQKVEVLKGNIGYIRITSFFELEPAFAHYRSAFDLVAHTNALILDLRGNQGGSTETAWPTQWTFIERGSPVDMMIESRADVSIREEPPVLWRRYGSERPLAVLIDKRTFSAPEAIAFTLQTSGRATIIGEPSGGGAHMLDDGTALSTGFTLYIPTSRPLSISTRENWEGKGITPDIVSPSDRAVARALAYLNQAASTVKTDNLEK